MPPQPATTGPAHPASALKFDAQDKTRLTGLLLPFYGPFRFKGQPESHPGSDSYKEHFTPKTDFALHWFKSGWPLLYHHGRDPSVDIVPIGRIESIEIREADPTTGAPAGGWMQAQLDEQNAYFDAITTMVAQGKMFLSSGAMNHLIAVNKRSGEILRWPVVEGSCTTVPANPLAVVDFTTATRHYKSAGIDLPSALDTVPAAPPTDDPDILCGIRAMDELHLTPPMDPQTLLLERRAWRSALTAADFAALSPTEHLASYYDPDPADPSGLRAQWTSAAINDLPDSAFHYIESGGSKDSDGKTTPRSLRHFPVRGPDGTVDLPHVRNALARIPDAHVPDDVKRRITATAKRLLGASTSKSAELDALLARQGEDGGADALRAWVLAELDDAAASRAADAQTDGRAGCYEERQEALRDALNPPTVAGSTVYVEELRTWGDRVLVRRCEDDTPDTYWSIRYHMEHDQAILGEQTLLDESLPPVRTAQIAAVSFTQSAQALTRQAQAFRAYTNDYAHRRTSEGRPMSRRNLDVTRAFAAAQRAVADDLDALVDAAEALAALEAKAAALLPLAQQQQRLRLLALAAATP